MWRCLSDCVILPRVARSRLARRSSVLLAALVLAGCATSTTRTVGTIAAPAEGARIKVLFLGDNGPHRPVERLRDIATPMLDRGIELVYTEDLSELSPDGLGGYDALLLYADHEQALAPEQEAALIGYVAGGGGFVPVHAAAGSFPGSAGYSELVGARVDRHDQGIVRTRIAEPNHAIMRGFEAFQGADESYLRHTHLGEDRVVLEYRDDQPYTWTRTHGEGRVFYTAWGHDERSWSNPGFHDLLERGIRWAAGQDVQQAIAARSAASPFRYAVLDVPFPPPHRVRVEYEQTRGAMDRGSNNPRFYQMQLAMSPDESMRRMIVPPGFRVELFAAEPEIVNPIAMNWDERGRLWVIESVEYPYTRELWPDGGGKDRIVVLEDTNGDGRADSVQEFSDGLHIPTGLTFSDGGVIVHQAPQTLFLKDTTGDGRADLREVLIDGWSQRDTHAGPSNLQYGLDNWIWGVLGYSGFNGEIGGEHYEFGMGVYRFRKDASKLEFLRRTNNNTWGLGFNEQGGAFISTANGNPSTYLQFPRKRYSLIPELADAVTESLSPTARFIALSNEFRQVDWVGAYTAGAGHAVYTARNYPREYWNRIAFVTEATGHLVGEFILEANGSSYRARHPRNLIASDDQWFSPVMAEVGPDGQVWIADWYNYVIQHNAESDRQQPSPGNAYANPLRDRQHGRIYRIVYEGAPAAERFSLAGATPRQLVQTLRHDNMFWRKHAQRLLVERGEHDVVPSLIELLEDGSVDELGLNVGAIHALWTLRGLGVLDGGNEPALAAAVAALEHPSAAVRMNAVQVLPRSQRSIDALLSARLVDSQDAQVRLAALVALAELPESTEAGRALYAVLSRPENLTDRWIREAAALAGAVHSHGFLAAASDAGTLPTAPAGVSESPNLLANASFEEASPERLFGWSPSTREGSAELTVARGEGRGGGSALKIASSAGADAAWLSPEISLQANTRYQLGGWIRTLAVERGTGRGAQLNLSALPTAATRTNPVAGTTDWSFHERTISIGAPATSSLELRFGEGGESSGEVWFDDVVLRELGAEPGSTLANIIELISLNRPSAVRAAAVGAPLAPAEAGADVVFQVGVIPDVLRFDLEELSVNAGSTVRIVFTNTDHMEHNLVILMPGTLEVVGQLADQLMLSPAGRQQQYVPNTPDVLYSTPVLEPGAGFELTFTAPTQPGRYPFVCTIPGHWRVMNGTLIVQPG